MAPENQGLARSNVPDRDTWLATLGGVFTRVVLFAIEGTNAKITGVRGVSDLLVGQTTSLAAQTPLRWAIEAASPIVGAGRSPSGELMTSMLKLAAPRAFAVVPLVFGKKLAGLAYGDCGNQPLPLASVSEVFAACEKLLNPSNKDRSALPDKGSFRSTARRDTRGNRTPRPSASRRQDVQVLMLTEVIDEEPPAPPELPEVPLPRDTIAEPPPPPVDLPPPPPIVESPPVVTRKAPVPRDPEPAPEERGFRRGRRRRTRPIARQVFDLGVEAPPPSPPREPAPQRAAKTQAPARKPKVLSPASLAASPPVATPKPKPPTLLASTPPTVAPSWVTDTFGLMTETQVHELAAFEGQELAVPRNAPAPTEVRHADSEIIHALRPRFGVHPLIIFAVTLAVCLTLFVTLAPPSSDGFTERVVTLPGGASASTVGAALADARLVRSATAFTVLGELTRTRGLRAGSYRISTGSWPWQVAAQLREAQNELLDVVVPEGSSLPEIAKRLDAAGMAETGAFTDAAKDPQLLGKYGIVAIDAQGWLAPGSYAMARGIGPVDAMSVMVERFKAQLATLPETRDLSAEALNRVLVLGSLVEKEAKDKTEARRIAGLFYNRLKLGMRLESRATALYILGVDKKELTLADVRQASPYNTFLNAGLPPGPIATPGLDALRAALHPEEHGYFYMTDRDDGVGGHVFSTTYEEHLKAQRENR